MGDFRGIIGKGQYRNRRGAIITLSPTNTHKPYMWIDEDELTYMPDGSFDPRQGVTTHDIVEGPLTDEQEMAGLRGYGVFRQGYCTFVPPHELPALMAVSEGEVVIDLKTIRKDQLVRPALKRETRKVTLVMYRNGAVLQWGQTSDQIRGVMDLEVVAVVEREIEFEVGEGLDVKP